MLVFFRKDGKRDTLCNLSLLMDIGGVAEYLLLGENGRRAADGNFGSNTEAAVRAAQADFGMEETGVADHDFQVQLYEGE